MTPWVRPPQVEEARISRIENDRQCHWNSDPSADWLCDGRLWGLIPIRIARFDALDPAQVKAEHAIDRADELSAAC